MTKRDEFAAHVKRALSARAGSACSNPECGASTSAPHEEPAKAVNLGVAAHITAAVPDGPRYDASLTPIARAAIQNAIWLCQNCAKLIDNDPTRFPVELLRTWKAKREDYARQSLGKGRSGMALSGRIEILFNANKISLIDAVEYQAVLAKSSRHYSRQSMFDESEELARNLDDDTIGRLLDHLPTVATNIILFHNVMDALTEAQAHRGALLSFRDQTRDALEQSEAAILRLPDTDRTRGYELLANCGLMMNTTRYFEAQLSEGLAVGLGSEPAKTFRRLSWWNTRYYGSNERNVSEFDRALRGDHCDYSLGRWQVALMMAAAISEPVDKVLEQYSIRIDDHAIRRSMLKFGRRFTRKTK